MLVRRLRHDRDRWALSAWWRAPTLQRPNLRRVILKDGQRITGEVVAEKPNALYVDLGYDILRIPRDQILRRAKVDEAARRREGIGPRDRARPIRVSTRRAS